MLEVRDLHVWFDLPHGRRLHAVQGLSLTLEAGDRLGLIGESGCGKTTATLALMGLLPANATVSGQIRLLGEDILADGENSIRPHRWVDLAMVFQGAMNSFNPVMTIGSQIAESMSYHGVASDGEAKREVLRLFELVGLPPERADRFPHEFSGGMRQRAAIAMAVACRPKVLLADEPTTALDVMVQAQILELLRTLSSELGLTLILVTHDLGVVAQLCPTAAVMYAGKIVELGRMDDLYHTPKHPYTRLLFAATPDIYGTGAIASIPGAPPRLDAPVIGCSFAPRCDRTFGPCHRERPQLVEVTEGHRAACHLNDPFRQAAQ